jgi:beta-lactamase class A
MTRSALLLVCACVCASAQPAALDQKVRAAVAGFPGKVFLYARNLQTGTSYGRDADARVRTASTIKLPIMTAVFAAVEAGKTRWTDELTLTDENRVSGSGVLSEFSTGVKIPLRDAMHLMIVVSDNTATNMILDRVPADAVNAEMDRLGLKQTRALRKIRGDGPNLKTAEGWSAAGRIAENQRFGLGVSTPREMVELLAKVYRGEVVSPAASREMIEVLKRQQYKDGIGRHMVDLVVASKSGALDHLRSDVGIVYSPGGPVVMAITCEDIPKVDYGVDNEGLLLISKLAEILVDGLRQ